MGVRVVIAPNEVAPSDIAHAALPTRRDQAMAAAPAVTVPTRTADATAGVTAAAMPKTATDAIADGAATARTTPPAAGSDKPADAAPGIRTAVASPAETSASASQPEPKAGTDAVGTPPAPAASVQTLKRSSSPIAVLISRKDGKLYARQNFTPVFETPITISGEGLLGTHVFTASADASDPETFAWSVISLPASLHGATDAIPGGATSRRVGAKPVVRPVAKPVAAAPTNTPREALDRIIIPDDARLRIAEALASASSIIVSDQSIKASGETGLGTDFIMHLR